MCVLADTTIIQKIEAKELVITPFLKENIQPSSLDVRLSHEFRVFKTMHSPFIDIREANVEDFTELIQTDTTHGLTIHPGEFLLGSTIEYFEIPSDIVARIEGRSTFGRLGIVVHSTAGYIDPGFKGNVTLEITNLSNMPITLYPNLRIAQVAFETMTEPAKVPYGSGELKSKYQNQQGPIASRVNLDFTRKPT